MSSHHPQACLLFYQWTSSNSHTQFFYGTTAGEDFLVQSFPSTSALQTTPASSYTPHQAPLIPPLFPNLPAPVMPQNHFNSSADYPQSSLDWYFSM